MEKPGRDELSGNSAHRVREHRARRRAAGLIELKMWVRESDRVRAWAVLRPLTDEADQALARHMQKGRTNQIAVTVRFAVKPPSKFRSTLRETWNLTWNGAQQCWHGTVEDAAARDELRRHVAQRGGQIEAD